MAELPTGTVTYLFTDIEGSTALWEQQADAASSCEPRLDDVLERMPAGRFQLLGTTGWHLSTTNRANSPSFRKGRVN